jgi:hypothetical protein
MVFEPAWDGWFGMVSGQLLLPFFSSCLSVSGLIYCCTSLFDCLYSDVWPQIPHIHLGRSRDANYSCRHMGARQALERINLHRTKNGYHTSILWRLSSCLTSCDCDMMWLCCDNALSTTSGICIRMVIKAEHSVEILYKGRLSISGLGLVKVKTT